MTDTLATPRLEQADPNDLVLDDNIRDEPDLTDEFLASVKAHGVLVPLLVRDVDGQLRITDGQRRWLAAKQAKLESVPVVVRAAAEGTAKSQALARVVEQFTANQQREFLTRAQEARAVAQMLDLGLSQTKTAATTGVAKSEVKQLGAVGRSETALERYDNGQLNLEYAAILASAEGDPELLEQLESTGRFMWDHVIQQHKDAAAEMRLRESQRGIWTEQGYNFLLEQPSRWRAHETGWYEHDQLVHDPSGSEFELSDITDRSRWSVWLDREAEDLILDKATGEEVDAASIDYATQTDPDATPAEGKVAFSTVEIRDRWIPHYFTTQLTEQKLRPEIDEPAPTSPGSSIQEESDKKEKESDERRQVIAMNKLAVSAEAVRHKFVQELLSRKTPPKEAAVFTAYELAIDPGVISYARRNCTPDLLRVSDVLEVQRQLLEESMTPARAQVIMLALIAGGIEGAFEKTAWRGITAHYWPKAARRWLLWLQGQGYVLSQIEEVVAGLRDLDAVTDKPGKGK